MKTIYRYSIYVILGLFPYITLLIDPMIALFWSINLGFGITLGYTWLIGSLVFAFMHNTIVTQEKQIKRTP